MIHAFPGLNVNLLLCLSLSLFLITLPNRDSRVRLIFVAVAVFFNVTYVSWRLHVTLEPFHFSFVSLWQWIFFLAELCSVVLLSWHLIVLSPGPRSPEESRRMAPPLPDVLPTVDVMIPTVNEPLDMLADTIRAAQGIDYARAKVWVLDDGSRADVSSLCARLGVGYLARGDRKGFKAGNLNHACRNTEGDFILCVDADFAVKPAILRQTLGYFQDSRIAIVQTPQHFVNPDAIQYNLGGEQAWPEEQRVFTDMIQPCRDKWDNAFCYGTNFVIRRAHLQAIGGFPEKSICEDLFATYMLKAKGWITRFHNEELAVGHAAMTLGEFIKQRVRWCTGTLQCLFLKGGPIFNTHLSLLDRMFFLDPALFYLSSIWCMLVCFAPAIYWWTGVAPFASDQGHVLMMLLPRMWISMFGLYWLTDRKVVPVISEIGRHVSIFHLVGAIFRSLALPFRGIFQVTLKDARRDVTRINWPLLAPHLALTVLTLAGIFHALHRGMASDLVWDENLGLVLALTAYVLWMNFFTLLACIEPPIRELAKDVGLAETGSITRSIHALARKVMQ